ncbi:MAG: HAD family hydrolase [Planctomycetota bacterium]|jgi:putative hydrolase of the HAD superfamily
MAHPALPPIQAVCFDLGGVLLRIVGDWAEACERADVPLKGAWSQPSKRRRLSEASNAFEIGAASFDDFAATICELSDYTRDEVERVVDAWLIEPFPGAGDMIDRLIATGVKTAVLSNTNERHWPAITDLDGPFAFVNRVGVLLPSYQIGARKPDAAAYLRVEEELQVPAEAILFFDDLRDNINAAVWQHWRTCHVDPRNDPTAQIIESLVANRVF